MSTTGNEDPAPGGQEGPAGAVGAQAGAYEGVDRNSEPRRGDAMSEAEAGGVAEASGGLREAALEATNAEEGSDIGPAEEEEEQAQDVDDMVEARRFPMSHFRLMFLDMVHSVLNRLYYNNHFLIQPSDSHVSVQGRTQQRLSDHVSAAVARFSQVQVPSDGPGEGPAEEAPDQEVEQAEEAQEAEEASLGETAAEEPEESSLWEMAPEPSAPEETTECQDENSKEEAQGTKSEGKEKKYNQKQEEPEKDMDPAKDRPRKSSLED